MTPDQDHNPLHETLVRWETSRREQLTGAITLVFGLSIGALAFCGSLLTEEKVEMGGARTWWFLVTDGQVGTGEPSTSSGRFSGLMRREPFAK